jgi:site-specific DNA-methyltransferase (adenine-specific)
VSGKTAIVEKNGAKIELRHGDSLVLLLEEDPGSVDCVTCSPPYNLGVKYRSYDDTISRADYLAWTDRWLGLVKDVLSKNGSLFLNMGGKPSDPSPPDDVLAVAKKHFVLQNRIAWIKSYTDDEGGEDGEDGGPKTFGHFKPINSYRYLNDTWEFVFHLTKTGGVEIDKLAAGTEYEDKSNLTRGNRGKNGDRRCRGNVWFCPYETIKSRSDDRNHPATFPIALAERCYLLHGRNKIQRSLDPFSGLGNSAVAAARLGLNHLAIELDEQDHEEARRRVAEVGSIAKTDHAPLFDGAKA